MRFVADLHIHSYLSRATSKDLNLEQLYRWSQLKGIGVVGTGDFTHPKWFSELREKLLPAESGLFTLRPEIARALDDQIPSACRRAVRFMLSVEISSIYKRADRVRKVHNLVYAPTFEVAAKIATQLSRIGNIESDGRPILGIDSRDLLEIVLEASPDAFLIPAHIWTPWFSALGAQSGFDQIADCYADLTEHIFAAETGLSSDPPMNWRLSQLDGLALVSNSDAHSPEKLGREANLFDCELSYFAIRSALQDAREGFLGTVEFFPEEGKYHFDGHRKCGVVLAPEQAQVAQGVCPKCGKRVTGGVMSRVLQLADRPSGFRPPDAKPFHNLVPLNELIGEVVDAGPSTVGVRRAYQRLLQRVGPELTLLTESPLEQVACEGPPLLAEALRRMRSGEIHVQPGYDGEYGVIRVFEPEERRRLLNQGTFSFALASAERRTTNFDACDPITLASPAHPLRSSTIGLNPDQRKVVEHGNGSLAVIAGPGTGKTRALTHRIAALVQDRGVPPTSILTITFTRKAAAELRERLIALLGDDGRRVQAMTFHALGLELLRKFPKPAGLRADFTVLDDARRQQVLKGAAEEARLRNRLVWMGERISWHKTQLRSPADADAEIGEAYLAYQRILEQQGAIDFDDLILRSTLLLERCDTALADARTGCRYLFVDEYQDINAAQYRLVRLLAPAGPASDLCVVGDPDQSIYGFRGSDPEYFNRFAEDYAPATVLRLTQNYRSTATIVRAALEVIAQSPGRDPSHLEALAAPGLPIQRWSCATEIDEAELIACEIERAVGGTSLYSLDSGRSDGTNENPLSFHEIAVLFRTSAQADAIGLALDRAGIPFQRVGVDPLTARPFVAELLSDLDCLVRRTSDHTAIPERLAHLAPYIGPQPTAEIIERLGTIGRTDPDQRSATDLLATLAVPFGTDIAGFLGAIAQMHENDLGLEPQKVALLTLHAAKGLEFPLVFIAGCEDGLIPLRAKRARSVNTEEERRLLYVGMTRAQRQLILTAATKRSRHGQIYENGFCPFLSTVSAELFEAMQGRRRPRRARQLPLL